MMMKRLRVIYNESLRHLLRHLTSPNLSGLVQGVSPPKPWWRKEDTHVFILSFSAFFVAITCFIA
jgi:hypothetical protein